jgi:large subunit ribosomal protein L25
MSPETDVLTVTPRDPSGSRSARRLRRSGQVPGVIYGGDDQPQSVQIELLTLNRMLAHAGNVIDLDVAGSVTHVLVKDAQRHPVTGVPQHIDFLRVRMDVAIQTPVQLELTGAEEAPGVVEGGVLNQEAREILVEALPGDIPETLTHDVSELGIGATLTLGELTAPDKVTFVDDPEILVATITLPTPEVEEEEPEVETETERIGEDGEPVEGEEGDGGDAESSGDDSSSDEE